MLDEETRSFYVHFWANDDAVKLAEALRSALVSTPGGRNMQRAARSARALVASARRPCGVRDAGDFLQIACHCVELGAITLLGERVATISTSSSRYFLDIANGIVGRFQFLDEQISDFVAPSS